MVVLLAHLDPEPSAWVRRFAGLIRPGRTVLDVGFAVTGVDRKEDAVASLRGVAEIVVADIEGGPWPLPDRRFDAVVVTNYLWRPLWPALRAALGP